jgi:hypothetical protein
MADALDLDREACRLARLALVAAGVRLREAAPSPPPVARSGDVALGGQDGRALERLLSATVARGSATLCRLAAAAVGRLVARGVTVPGHQLFTDAELAQLAETLAAALATADLTGRALVRDYQRRTEADESAGEARPPGEPSPAGRPGALPPLRSGAGAAALPVPTTPGVRLPEGAPHDPRGNDPVRLSPARLSPLHEALGVPVTPLPPERAIRYFAGLVPSLQPDPERFGPALRRRAFTLAVATSESLARAIQEAILERLHSGDLATGPAAVRAILIAAGVHPANSQYAEMTFRTNTMDAFNAAAEEERMQPDVRATFPVWKYAGIEDGREGDDHRPHFGKYYPANVPFHQVRGERVFNCRCVPIPISKGQWRRLKADGARIADGYPDVLTEAPVRRQ